MNYQAETDWDRLCDITDELMKTGRFQFRNDAMLEAQRLNPHLDRSGPGAKYNLKLGSRAHNAPSAGGGAEAQLAAKAKQVSEQRQISFAQAYVQAMSENPNLYVQYLHEHPEQWGGKRG